MVLMSAALGLNVDAPSNDSYNQKHTVDRKGAAQIASTYKSA